MKYRLGLSYRLALVGRVGLTALELVEIEIGKSSVDKFSSLLELVLYSFIRWFEWLLLLLLEIDWKWDS